ncbi:MAG: SRPBCC domain-containing protein [Chitinophagaceae bacterium]|nr:MAG: SRPBCC domain-containing protein [Chitinophagaceae bacterium]
MEKTQKFQIEKDPANKKVTVTRYFDATPDKVWRAWTEAEYLDKWWGPEPWRAETKELSFRPGGRWLYAMVGPEGERQWSKLDFVSVEPDKSFEGIVVFCDEAGKPNPEFGETNWKNVFEKDGDGTKVTVRIIYDSEETMKKFLEMGFEQGFGMGLNQLEKLLSA